MKHNVTVDNDKPLFKIRQPNYRIRSLFRLGD